MKRTIGVMAAILAVVAVSAWLKPADVAEMNQAQAQDAPPPQTPGQ